MQYLAFVRFVCYIVRINKSKNLKIVWIFGFILDFQNPTSFSWWQNEINKVFFYLNALTNRGSSSTIAILIQFHLTIPQINHKICIRYKFTTNSWKPKTKSNFFHHFFKIDRRAQCIFLVISKAKNMEILPIFCLW